VSLPLANAEAAKPQVERPKAGGGTETILVIEDNPLVRSIVAALLEERGYDAITVDGGEAAIAACAEFGDEIDLVVTDLVMPGLDGRETIEQLRVRGCGAKVLYMSGYADDELRRGVIEAGTDFLQKPFDGDALAQRVREILDAVPA
jgi:two-component system cell cycle sensor histidine kinase/response regulator CckA